MSYIQRPKSDLGTILLHWLIVAALLSAAVTGLSIAAADNPNLWAVRYFGFLLPGENIWFWHLSFGIGVLSSFVAYVIYIRRAKLLSRIHFSGARFTTLIQNRRSLSAAFNVLLYWILFGALALEIATGTLLFLGWGGIVLTLHLQVTWFFLIFLVLHPLTHWFYGGANQLMRVFRPQWRLPQRAPELVDALIERVQQLETAKVSPGPGNRLPAIRERQPKAAKPIPVMVPLAIAIIAGAVIGTLSTSVDQETRQTLQIARISPANAPSLDGDISDPAWRRAPATVVLTQHGANFDGGESLVEVRALHDGKYAYFAFTWTDPTRSLMHMPLVKQEDGWHLMRSAAPGNETQFHEDKFAVLLVGGGQHLIGKGIHFGQKPLSDKPADATGRGLHFLEAGSGDIWQWRASHGGLNGWIDNGHFGAPLPGSAPQPSGRYTGGFALAPGPRPYRDNFTMLTGQEIYPLVRPFRFPKSAARFLRLASLSLDPENSDAESSSFSLRQEDSVPYSDDIDRVIPVGAVIPSILLTPGMAKDPDTSVTGSARWASGRWSLELKRRLDTGSPKDVVIKTGSLMWVAAFDHAETWHTYHIRPLELEVE